MISSTATVLGDVEGKVKPLSIVYNPEGRSESVLRIDDPLKKFKIGQSREQAMSEYLMEKQKTYLADNFPGMFHAKHVCGIVHLVKENPEDNADIECICKHRERWPKDRHGRTIQPTVCRLGHYWFNHALDFKKDCSECRKLQGYTPKAQLKKIADARKAEYEEEGIPVGDKNRRKVPGYTEKKMEYDRQAQAIVEAMKNSDENRQLQERVDKLERLIEKMEAKK